ncbi:hypothetical protein BY458DRAFT_511032 [Sporodiniella umbellata]|nr:hypothetical protein BY458DRAFT_511032 [Sporodiniella umbellata]
MADNDHEKKLPSKHGFVERFFRVTPTKNTAFVSKLYEMVNEEKFADLISWSGSGDRFTIYDNIEFSSKVLPQYFKHCNWSSFVRQLNSMVREVTKRVLMSFFFIVYDFHKMNDFNKDDLQSESQQRWDFKHKWFTRQGSNKLHRIKRKTAKTRLYFQPENHEVVDERQEYSPPPNPASDYVSSNKNTYSESDSPEPSQIHRVLSELPSHPDFQNNSSMLSVQNIITQLTCTVENMQFKLDSTTKEVLQLRQITAKQQRMLDDILSLVSKSTPPLHTTNDVSESKKPRKIHELLGSDDLPLEETGAANQWSSVKRLKG